MGESAAAVVAGALSLEDGARVICRRSRLMTTIAGAGAMASVELPAQQVLSELMARGVNDVVVAVVASPQSTVIGGATQTVRDLVAAWEQRDVMAREVAVDVASHSPQVDPILDELTEVLADISPMTPEVPYYSATSFDPREQPYCDAGYWADNLRHTVRFAAAVQAALEDGYRVFAELSPHPLLTHAVEQTARSLDMTVAALAAHAARAAAAARAARPAGDLHCAGAAVDFSVLYPDGRLVDAPLPAWTHRPLLLTRDGQKTPTHGGSRLRCIRCWARMCGCPRSRSATSGRPRSAPRRCPGWPITRSTVWPPFRGPPTARWRWPRPAPSSARHPRSAMSASSRCCCSTRRPRSVPPRRWRRPVSSTFVVETNQDGEHARRASAVLHAAEDDDQPAAHDMAALLAAHPCRVNGDRPAGGVRPARYSVRSCLHRPGRRAHCRGERQHGAGRSRAARLDPLTTGRLRRASGAAGCLFPVGRRPPRRRGHRQRRPAVAVGCAPAACLRPGPQRPLLLHEGDQCRRGRDRGRPRCAGRARDGPAGGARTANRNRGLRARQSATA